MKLKQLFGSIFSTPKERIESILKKYNIKNYVINDDLTVDVNGDIDFRGADLKRFPVKFGKIIGNFNCSNNQLETLNGGPNKVSENFYCYNNNLTSLQGSPREVGENFWCVKNKFTSLQGSPREVGGDFACSYGNLVTLRGAPREVGGDFDCLNNPPTKITGWDWYCPW